MGIQCFHSWMSTRKIQSDGSIEKLKLRILVGGDLQNNEVIRDIWYPTASMRTLKYFPRKCFHEQSKGTPIGFHWSISTVQCKPYSLVKLDIRYGEYLPEYCNYFGIPLILKKSMYGITNYVKRFSDDLTDCLIYVAGSKKSQLQMSIHYKYAPYGSRIVVL